jgi:hypothetical protein
LVISPLNNNPYFIICVHLRKTFIFIPKIFKPEILVQTGVLRSRAKHVSAVKAELAVRSVYFRATKLEPDSKGPAVWISEC